MGGRIVDWDSIPESTLLPEDLYQMEVEDITEETSRERALFMYKATFRVIEPAAFAGVPLFDYFVIGNEEDPTAQQAATWKASIGASRLHRLIKATGVPKSGDVDEVIETLKGQRFVARVGQEVDNGVRDPKYKGVIRNRINAMYTLAAGASQTAPTASAPPVKTAATPAAPAAKTARPAVATAANITCPFCSTVVPRAQYNAHVKANHPEEG